MLYLLMQIVNVKLHTSNDRINKKKLCSFTAYMYVTANTNNNIKIEISNVRSD